MKSRNVTADIINANYLFNFFFLSLQNDNNGIFFCKLRRIFFFFFGWDDNRESAGGVEAYENKDTDTYNMTLLRAIYTSDFSK